MAYIIVEIAAGKSKSHAAKENSIK